MSTDVKWMDAAELDRIESGEVGVGPSCGERLIAQSRAALSLRKELAECRARSTYWYEADGTVTTHAPEVVVQRRKDAAKEIADLRAKLAQAQMEGGVWRCSCCGELRDESASWRWNGERWEHKCAESLPQAGHMPAECSGFVMPHASVVDLMFRLAQAEQERDGARLIASVRTREIEEADRVCTEQVAAAQAENVRAFEALAAWRDVEMSEGTDISDEDMMALNATAHDLTTRCLAGYKPGSREALREMLTKMGEQIAWECGGVQENIAKRVAVNVSRLLPDEGGQS